SKPGPACHAGAPAVAVATADIDKTVRFLKWYDNRVDRRSRICADFRGFRSDRLLPLPVPGGSVPRECHIDDSGRYRMDARLDRARVAHDPGPRVFLRRSRPVEERAQHD